MATNSPVNSYGGDWEIARGLSLRSRKRLSGFAAGEQRSPSTGGGIEFADYREYVSGDDIRLLDWAVYLRSRKLLVKLCAEEKELTLIALVDISRSMDFGVPNKLLFAKRVAATLACVALGGGNRAGVAALGETLLEPIRPERKKLTMAGIARAVHSMESVGSSLPEACVRQFAERYRGKCVAVLISDLLFPEWKNVLDALASANCEAHVLQVLSPEELDPADRGELTLVDMEDGSELPTQIDGALLERYDQAVNDFMDTVGVECARRGLGRVVLRSDAELTRVFYGQLKAAGIVW